MTTPQEPQRGGEPSAELAAPKRSLVNLFLTLHLPAISIGLGMGLTAVVLPDLTKSLGEGVGAAIGVFVVYQAGTVVAPLPTGYLIDRIGRRPLLLAGPVIVAISSFLIAYVAANDGSIVEFLVYRFIGGIGEQMWMLSRITVIADTAPRAQRGRQITSMFGVQQFGALAGPVLGGLAAVTVGLWLPFVLHGAIVLAAMVPSFLLQRETAPPRRAAGGEAQPASSWRELLVHPIPVVFLVQFLANITRGGVFGGGVILIYGSFAYGLSALELGSLRSLMAVIGIPMTFTAGFIMDRYGRKVTIVPGLALSGLAMAYLALTWYADLSVGYFIGGFIGIHMAVNIISGNMQTLGTDVAPPSARGRFFGFSRLIAQSGSFMSPVSFGVLSTTAFLPFVASYTIAFSFLAATALTASVIVSVFIKETLHRPQRGE